MQRGRLFPWISVIAVLFVVSTLVWIIFYPGQQLPPSQTLSDGSVVRITKVSYGKSVTIARVGGWQGLIGEFLGGEIAPHVGLGGRVMTLTMGADTAFIFIETTRTNGTFRGAPKAMPFTFHTSVVAADDVGNEFRLDGPNFQGIKPSNTNTLVEVFHVPLVSHQANKLNLRLVQSDMMAPAHQQFSEFVILNPAPHSKPKWNTQQLPLTNVVDQLKVVFAGSQSATDSVSFLGFTNNCRRSVPRLLFFENGMQATNWNLARFDVADEEGSIAQWPGLVSPLETRRWRFELEHTLQLRKEDILRLEHVPVPGGTNTFSPVSAGFEGNTVTITRLSKSQMNYEITPGLPGRKARLTMQYKEESGNLRKPLNAMVVGTSGETGTGFLPLPESVKSVDLIFEFPHTTTHWTEFIARLESETNSAARK